MGMVAYKTGTESEVILMRSTVLIRGLGGNLEKTETELNERLAEKEKDGWKIVDMQITRPSFGAGPVIILRLARESNQDITH